LVAGGPVLYHSGDTSVFGDMRLVDDLYLVLLPIGGHCRIGPREAARAAGLPRPGTVLPLHLGTFPPLKRTGEQLARLVEPGVKVVS